MKITVVLLAIFLLLSNIVLSQANKYQALSISLKQQFLAATKLKDSDGDTFYITRIDTLTPNYINYLKSVMLDATLDTLTMIADEKMKTINYIKDVRDVFIKSGDNDYAEKENQKLLYELARYRLILEDKQKVIDVQETLVFKDKPPNKPQAPLAYIAYVYMEINEGGITHSMHEPMGLSLRHKLMDITAILKRPVTINYKKYD
jgi:hypothetical protein